MAAELTNIYVLVTVLGIVGTQGKGSDFQRVPRHGHGGGQGHRGHAEVEGPLQKEELPGGHGEGSGKLSVERQQLRWTWKSGSDFRGRDVSEGVGGKA